ncbi:hypothetical protein BJ875DRAFT_50245 [Amylocarpus encephaloides]|uniref:BZIP domain-containing protein n=1 Tax=Amylocarpus encephaloides TaxID=45428 RepID=A0A9P7YHY4_9HELO|nr:hypothetical protein BJ875DRAFT_50245 [Amylocarpus encephaloides]
MSQRPPVSRPASRSPPDGQRTTIPSLRARDDLPRVGEQAEGPRRHREGGGLDLQPSPQRARPSQHGRPAEDWRASAPSRDLGVHSMLNPSEPDSRGAGPRHSGASTDAPPHSDGPPPFGQPSTTPTPPTTESHGPSYPHQRRILTPRSPSRSLSSSRGRGGTTIDAQRSPFLSSRGRAYATETGHAMDSPSAPSSTHPQQHYGRPPSTSIPADSRRTSVPTMHAYGQGPLSQSASPSISTSSQNPSSQTSPASFLVHKGGPGPPTSSYFPSASFGSSMHQAPGGGGMQGMQYQGPSEGPYSAPAPQTPGGGSSLHPTAAGSRQTSASDPIQVLTITTSSGQYQVPVDVHQASRVADEKRARNAGASARFRQRRKEKEKEANTNIEKLQQQTRELERKVREVEQERDFYRTERDRFRDVVFRTPEVRHLAMQAPPSPTSMQGNAFAGPGQQLGGPPHPTGFHSQPPTPLVERAPRRRRMDTQGDFASVAYHLPPASTLPPVQGPGYPHGPAPGPQSLPPLRMDAQPPPHGAVSTQPPSTSGPPAPYDPYARGPGPFERSSWPGPGDNPRR